MAEPLILPKGIVINTSWIYDEIAKQPVVSPEAIKKYWRVYTTTFQRLIDPTANRLENFWWHVWGSDRRHLPGPVLARLFEDISTGPTFVKLRGPPNRYEPPSQPPSPGSTPVQPPVVQAVPGASQEVLQPKVDQRAIAPSSTKKPPGKPILKKPRGPSASGPRPTARFVSPLGSDAEDVGSRDSEVASSTSTTTVTPAGGEMKAPGNSNNKKKATTAGPPKKKGATFVASSSETSRARRVIALTSSSTAQTSNATAQGTIIEFDENLPTRQLQEENETLQSEPRRTGTASTSPLDPRFTPTLPSATPAVPLGRSKSQLTLLLERQGEKKPRR
ncbi:hypothetical protein SLS62_001384 [Diatrype stigma]|uniref:Nitrogen regulatory protein areA GATA-like domain-containing protein n=1 Tax=Diatrype stigma TaxID=117547 RepID=A0AAN9VAH6_9PEZI